MNLEELRLNKGLLKEISKYKRANAHVSENQSNQENLKMDFNRGDLMSN